MEAARQGRIADNPAVVSNAPDIVQTEQPIKVRTQKRILLHLQCRRLQRITGDSLTWSRGATNNDRILVRVTISGRPINIERAGTKLVLKTITAPHKAFRTSQLAAR